MFPAMSRLKEYNNQLANGSNVFPLRPNPILEKKTVFPKLKLIQAEDKSEVITTALFEICSRAKIEVPEIIVTQDTRHSQGTAATGLYNNGSGIKNTIFYDTKFIHYASAQDIITVTAHELSHIALKHTEIETIPQQVQDAKIERLKSGGYAGFIASSALVIGAFVLKKSIKNIAIPALALGALAWYGFHKWYSANVDLDALNKRLEFDADELGARLTGDKASALDLLQRTNEMRNEKQTLQERYDHLKAIKID